MTMIYCFLIYSHLFCSIPFYSILLCYSILLSVLSTFGSFKTRDQAQILGKGKTYPTVVIVTNAHQKPSPLPLIKDRGNSSGLYHVSCGKINRKKNLWFRTLIIIFFWNSLLSQISKNTNVGNEIYWKSSIVRTSMPCVSFTTHQCPHNLAREQGHQQR